jgi:hypothetical protein
VGNGVMMVVHDQGRAAMAMAARFLHFGDDRGREKE